MCSCYAGARIISRPLNRCKIIYVCIVGYYHDPPWVLSGCSLDSGAALNQSVHFCAVDLYTLCFIVFLYKSICSLICNGTNGTCPEYITLSKKLFCVFMSLRLVFSCEVQVNIRLLVSVKAQKHLKGYVMPFLPKCSTTFRTVLF